MAKQKLRISGETKPIKDFLKNAKFQWNAEKSRWWIDITDYVADQLLSGDLSILDAWNLKKKGCLIHVGEKEVWRSKTYGVSATASGDKIVSVVKDHRVNLVGTTINVGGVPHVCVAEIKAYGFTEGLSRGMGRDEGWCHDLAVRPMKAEEIADRAKQQQIDELERELRYFTGPLDDDRNAEAFAAKAAEVREKLEQIKNG